MVTTENPDGHNKEDKVVYMYSHHVADMARKVDGVVDGADREGDVSAGEGNGSDGGEEMTESKKPHLNYKLTSLAAPNLTPLHLI